MFDFIDHVLYINLDHRTDRRELVERELAVFGDRVQRIPAIHYSDGMLGCNKSHQKALEYAKTSGWRNVLIVEDDFQWINLDTSGADKFTELVAKPFDVILLCGSYVECNFATNKLYRSQAATAYFINSHYYDKLIDNFKESFQLLKRTGDRSKYSIDVYWNNLIKTDNWYLTLPMIATQRESFSDIEGKVMNYAHCFAEIKDV